MKPGGFCLSARVVTFCQGNRGYSVNRNSQYIFVYLMYKKVAKIEKEQKKQKNKKPKSLTQIVSLFMITRALL